jgi:hypothetical protein
VYGFREIVDVQVAPGIVNRNRRFTGSLQFFDQFGQSLQISPLQVIGNYLLPLVKGLAIQVKLA